VDLVSMSIDVVAARVSQRECAGRWPVPDHL